MNDSIDAKGIRQLCYFLSALKPEKTVTELPFYVSCCEASTLKRRHNDNRRPSRCRHVTTISLELSKEICEAIYGSSKKLQS